MPRMLSNSLTRCLGPLALAATVSLFGLAACGDNGTENGACTTDEQCGRGKICGSNGACEALECSGSGDCLNGFQACIDTATGSFCSAVECGCANCDACPEGKTCTNFECLGAGQCDPVSAPCSGTDICDNGTCRACSGDECPTTNDCTVSGCSGGQVCNTTTKLCENAPAVAACTACANDDACGGGGAKCVPLATGQACLLSCDTNSDCDTGWSCGNHLCSPNEGRCEGCFVNGCGNGQACNPTGGICEQAVAECGTCTDDWQCGDGRSCFNGKCTERCNGGTCASGGNCVADAGVMVCEDACASECPTPCSGPTPYCVGGGCAECRNNADCDNGQTCNTSTHACQGTVNCQDPTPIPWQDTCVQCLANTDCNGQFCNISTHECTSSQCASCAAPYPSCVTIGDDSYCVQCDPAGTADEILAQCGVGATCNDSTYACEGGTVTPTTVCHQDSDCVGGEAGGFDLKCDVASGFCYDRGGLCDDVTAYCPGTNGQLYECKSFFDAFGAGGAPPPDTGGGTIPGFCGCECDLPGVCFGPGTCQPEQGNCSNFGALFGMPNSEPFCFAFE